MIVTDHTSFVGRSTTLKKTNFECKVVTSKEGLFKGYSTIIIDMDRAFLYHNQGVVAKIIYNDLLKKEARLDIHSHLIKILSEAGDNEPLGYLIDEFCSHYQEENMINSYVNLA